MSRAITRRLICSLLPSLIVGGGHIAVAKSALPKMQNRRKVRTVAELIEAMGGTEATAEWAGVDKWWIDEWRSDGIPNAWHYRLDRTLSERGFEVDPMVFYW